MRLFAPISLIFITILTACGTSLPARDVDSNFVWDGFNWQGGGGIYVSMKTFSDQGKVGLCGVYSSYDASDPQDRFSELGFSAIYVTLGDKVLTYNIDFFERVPFKQDTPPTGRANCRRTGTDWKPEFASLDPDAVTGKSSFTVYD